MDNRFKLVMADDDREDQMLVQLALKDLGYDIVFNTVNDGEALLEYLSKNKGKALPNLILLDINMPKLDGKGALTRLRSNEETKHLPVAMFSTSSSPQDIKQCYQLGANCYLIKPNGFSTLVSSIEDLYNFWFKTATLPA